MAIALLPGHMITDQALGNGLAFTTVAMFSSHALVICDFPNQLLISKISRGSQSPLMSV